MILHRSARMLIWFGAYNYVPSRNLENNDAI